ncbi:ABC transporter substrate-binding protein [Hominifimenecus sp. rT4P-3]|uniref:ABC transporter substrate-binding protein n=1 Tax=Hominifimenecus sp. rT4P-3 TaxID=3242979 RepID=UPI003DA3E160
MKKRVLAVGLCIAMLLSGCSGGSTGTSPEGKETTGAASSKAGKTSLVMSTSAGEPANLHPYNTSNLGVKNAVCGTIFETLVRIGMDGSTLEPCLAESWEYGDDNLSLTFHLRKGVHFHDGEEMKASDVVFTMGVWGESSKIKATVSAIDFANVKAEDDYTVYVPLKVADSGLLANLADMQNMCVIVGEKSWNDLGEEFQNRPVGTGPYKFKEWMQGDRIELERFDDYWEGTPALETVTIRYINELSQAMIELETGGVDAVMESNSADVQRVQNGETQGLKVISSEGTSLRANNLNFNHNSTYMSNVLVRKAIACAIDKNAICNIIWPIEGNTNVSVLTKDTWGYNAALEEDPYAYDLERAKQYMAEAGYEQGFTVKLLTDSRSYHTQTAEAVQNMLSQINIKVEIETLELAAQKDQYLLKGEGYDMYLLDLVFSNMDPLYGLYRSSHPQFSVPNSSQYTYYTGDHAQEYGALLDKIMVEFDETKKQELTYELQDLFLEDMIWVSICSKEPLALAVEGLQGTCIRGNGQLAIDYQTHFE